MLELGLVPGQESNDHDDDKNNEDDDHNDNSNDKNNYIDDNDDNYIYGMIMVSNTIDIDDTIYEYGNDYGH